MKRRKKKSVNIVLVLMLLFGIIAVYFCIYMMKKDTIKGADESKKIIKSVQDNTASDVLNEVKKLYDINNDLAGYLIVPGTKINYPVMYTGSDYYLRKNFQKEYQEEGSLYIDKYNSISPRDTNLIIYGHNMNNNGTMFNDLEKYKEKTFYDKHKYFNYYTLKEKETYEIVAVFLSKVYYVDDDVFKYYKFYNASSAEEMNDYYENIKSLSLYDTKTKILENDYLITLSTCEYSQKNGRLVVVGRKITSTNN